MQTTRRFELSLLDYVGHRVGVEFLSDLRRHTPSLRSRLTRVLREIPAEAATPWEWQDTYQYLTGQVPSHSGKEDIRGDLLRVLSAV